MAIIDFYIRNQKLSKTGPKIVADSINYVDCSFTFRTDDWDGIDKWVVFKKGEESYRVNLEENSIPKEAGLNLGEGIWNVSLFGENSEGTKRITTNSVTVEVAKSAIPEGGALPVIALSEAEQISAKAQRALDLANEVFLKAENGDFNGEPGPQGPKGEKGTDGNVLFSDLSDEQKASLKGETGATGPQGPAGYSPVKGVDYFTEEEKTEMINSVLEQIPFYDGSVG